MSFRNQSRYRQFGPTVTNNTYAGEAALPYMSAAIGAGDNLAKGWVRELSGIVAKGVVPKFDASNALVEAGACDFASNNTTTLTDRVVTLTDLQVNESICRKTVYPTFSGASTGRAETDSIRSEFGQFIVATVAAKAAEIVDKAIWKGGAFAGFLSNDGTLDTTGFEAGTIGTGCQDVTLSTITGSNAIASISSVYEKAAQSCPAVLTQPDVAIYVGPKTHALYLYQLGTTGSGYANFVTNQDMGEVSYLGVPVRRCLGIPDNCIVLSYASNLVVGNNNGTDLSTVQYIPSYLYDGSDNIKVVMRMAIGTRAVTPGDVVVGTTSAIST